ncbi:DoxX family protein [Thalassotalea marina]|uniref:DoxX family protein n=1 Tax=Thalassotalea marina TaxID=1673741 RepID=A0A919BN64_9GAMM|nr:hypothetical protein [Thalassotalea marina]GHG02885.1 hypothetical protein GCM10017161_34860 [Thalassotalea marina]
MITPLIILFLLSSPLVIAFIVGKHKNEDFSRQKFAAWGLGLAFLFFAMGHFVKTQGMIDMLPAWVPFRLALVYVTGVIELVIAIGLFLPQYRILAAKMAIVVFVVFFPANIYAAFNSIGLGGHQWGPVYLLIRLPLQIVLISWAYFMCVKPIEKIK